MFSFFIFIFFLFHFRRDLFFMMLWWIVFYFTISRKQIKIHIQKKNSWYVHIRNLFESNLHNHHGMLVQIHLLWTGVCWWGHSLLVRGQNIWHIPADAINSYTELWWPFSLQVPSYKNSSSMFLTFTLSRKSL